jgi:hypothetical protein
MELTSEESSGESPPAPAYQLTFRTKQGDHTAVVKDNFTSHNTYLDKITDYRLKFTEPLSNAAPIDRPCVAIAQ